MLGCSPAQDATVTTRIVMFLGGDPKKQPSFATGMGGGDNPRYMIYKI